MIQGQEKPKILLLRRRADDSISPENADAWNRLGKALKIFTEFEEREVSEFNPQEHRANLEHWDHLLLDSALADWGALGAHTFTGLTLVAPRALAWTYTNLNMQCIEACARHPFLVLENLSTSDMVRILHLYLLPKRLAGVAPVMEKGSLIVGEKAMETYHIGSLLDRLGAHLEKIDGLELRARLPDLRQVLSALIFEGLRCARAANVLYPYVDFQASASKKKIGVNLRFPMGPLLTDQLVRDTLCGANLFWSQIWQCSDAMMITEHKQHAEIEVTLVIFQPERSPKPKFNSLLFKKIERSPAKENLLEAPSSYQFRLLADIQLDESDSFLVAEEEAEDIDLSTLPENVASRIRNLDGKCEVLNESLLRKDFQLQESLRKNQSLSSELSQKRGEALRLMKTLETQSENSERRTRDLEEKISILRSAANQENSSKASNPLPAAQEAVARLESLLRSAEAEKTALRENVAHEQKRVMLFEQKYSSLYKDNAGKDREIHELKAAFQKFRREQAKNPSPSQLDSQASLPEKLKEIEIRELAQKQEIRKLTFKLENHEKFARAQQAEAGEKMVMLEQKLKGAKVKELELLKKIEELSAAMKRLQKAA